MHDQIGAEHEVHLIDCCYAKGGVLVALHKSDMPKLDEQQWIYYEGAAFNIVPFNLVWADRPTRLIFRKWLDNPNNHIHWEP